MFQRSIYTHPGKCPMKYKTGLTAGQGAIIQNGSSIINSPASELWIPINKLNQFKYKDFYAITDENGDTNDYSHTFKLYREQPINIYANLYSDLPDFLKNYSISSDFIRISWDEIHAKADFGESVTIGTYALRIYGDKP